MQAQDVAAQTGRVARTAQMDSSLADKMGPTVPAGGSQIRNRIKGRQSGLCPQAVVQRKGGSQLSCSHWACHSQRQQDSKADYRACLLAG